MNALLIYFFLIWHLIIHSALAVGTSNSANAQGQWHNTAPEPAPATQWDPSWARTGIGGAIAATIAASSLSTLRKRKRAARRRRSTPTNDQHTARPGATRPNARTGPPTGASSASN